MAVSVAAAVAPRDEVGESAATATARLAVVANVGVVKVVVKYEIALRDERVG